MSLNAHRRAHAGFTLLALVAFTSCVTTDLKTGQPVPRGDQRYPFDVVKERAERLANGMTKLQVLQLLGTPADHDEPGNLWVYLPERYGILIPASALRLEFRDDLLADFSYRPIVLGARL